MKTIEEIFKEGREVDEIISDLKIYYKTNPSWSELQKEFDPKKHDIKTDPTLRPNDKRKNGKVEKPAKLTYSAEKIVTRRMTQMAFSIPVKRVYNIDSNNELHKQFKDAIEGVYHNVRINGVNARRMYAFFGSCEMATFWYLVETADTHTLYGFPTNMKIRQRSYSPMPKKYSNITQAEIYPLYDDSDDLIALSVEYKQYVGDTEVYHIDCFTAKRIYYYKKENSEWEVNEVENPNGKIPAVYLSRPMPVYEDIHDDREEVEFTLSRNSDIIRKNSNPILKVSGKIVGEKPVGDNAREVYQMEQGGDIGLISPSLATENAAKHIMMLKQNIEENTQLPNLSLENIRGLGTVSGESRKTLLADAQMKVDWEAHDITLALDREFNVIKALLCNINPSFDKIKDEVTCEHVLTAFIQDDEGSNIDKFSKACQKPVMSQKTAIQKLGIIEDVEAEIENINAEAQADAARQQMMNVFSAGM